MHMAQFEHNEWRRNGLKKLALASWIPICFGVVLMVQPERETLARNAGMVFWLTGLGLQVASGTLAWYRHMQARQRLGLPSVPA
jgi:hypothetical protein